MATSWNSMRASHIHHPHMSHPSQLWPLLTKSAAGNPLQISPTPPARLAPGHLGAYARIQRVFN